MRTLGWLAALAVAACLSSEAAQAAPEDAVICRPDDPECVRQARHDLLREIRVRYGHYIGRESGGPVDMFLRGEPEWDRMANERIVRAVREKLRQREVDVWGKGQAWDGQFYPMEQQFIEVYFRFPDRLTPEAKSAIEQAWKEALFTDAEAQERGPKWRRDGTWYWTQMHSSVGGNWGLIAAEAAILGGQIARRPDFVAEGRRALQRWFPYTSETGMVSQECNLMEGHWVIYSFCLAPIARWAEDPAVRRLARLLLERVWLEKLIYFHPGTLRECGASGRCVGQGKGEPVVDTGQRLWLATQLDEPIPYPTPPPAMSPEVRNAVILQDEPYLVSDWRIPDYLQDIAFRKQIPQVLRSTNGAEGTPAPWTFPPGWTPLYPDPRRDRFQLDELYTYLTDEFALGTMSRDWANTAMPALAFWKAHPGRPKTVGDHRALYFRYQHNDRKPFGTPVSYINGQEVELQPHQCWAEFGRHAAMQDKGRAILFYRPRLDYLMTYGMLPGVPSFVTFDKELAVTSLEALACFYREDVSPKGFFIGTRPVAAFPAAVGRGQWVFLDDGDTWTAVYPLGATDLGGSLPPRLVAGDRHVFLQVDNWRPGKPEHPDPAKLLGCRSGFLLAMGDRTDYPSFAAFRKEILASKVVERADGARQWAEWTAGKKTLRLGWDAYEERYLERSVNGETVEPWPAFSSPEYVQATCIARLADATATTQGLRLPVWLLAARASQTYVAYQPNPEQQTPLTLETPVGSVNTGRFPFGKVVLRKVKSPAGAESLRLEVDAEYPSAPNVAMTLEVKPSDLPLTAVVNGQAVEPQKSGGAWRVVPPAGP